MAMISIKRILCPVDFSDFSRHALDYAVGIARWYGAEITALHVIPPIMSMLPVSGEGLYPPLVFRPEELQQFRGELESFARDSGVEAAHAEVVQGSVAGEIVRCATELPADLLVMGTHGRSGFDRLMLGSVTEKLLRKSPSPLLTVPPRSPAVAPVDALFSRVLCAVDFSPPSLHALAMAQSLAGEAAARLCVMHVLEPVSIFEPVVAVGPDDLPAVNADHRREVRHRLEGLVHSETRAFSDVAEVVISGKPYQEILRAADEQRSDLIVLGAHGGRRGLPIFGSTAAHVVREAQCPVLTVR
jgi:nucleotide-binding universal stress UspA family protein